MAREVVVFVRCDRCNERSEESASFLDMPLRFGEDFDKMLDLCMGCAIVIKQALMPFIDLGMTREQWERQQERTSVSIRRSNQRSTAVGPLGPKLECEVCGRPISTKNMPNHMAARHTTETPRERMGCPWCSDKVAVGSGLALHAKAKHPEHYPLINGNGEHHDPRDEAKVEPNQAARAAGSIAYPSV